MIKKKFDQMQSRTKSSTATQCGATGSQCGATGGIKPRPNPELTEDTKAKHDAS